ncbi:NUDIX hydrolase [Paeniglutamicibacter gangotriensis]|uniref:NTP pyrophosphohydrolase including oxidative damage repair enzyme n=1 Tax=Paeniglutamicibacter gangotriensis Lz1y TaxID=1276920 RepID=M7MVD6_9MICC|nr:CoA pyrophosphatase [Paeniglutamicibacter gangotriensis]EMQ98880.1 NTP pyrophosphohydrolase including oxidative damage repair enzyme [Paeniglutamicibacter gangotriensis Lz1y]
MNVRTELLDMIAAKSHLLGRGVEQATKMPENWVFNPLDPATARHAAVLILFGRLDDVPAASTLKSVHEDLDVLFVTRADTLRKHAGQVAFPGGKVDAEDVDSIAAALREAREETGLDPDGVEILGVLPDAELPITNFIVTPVIGWWHAPSEVFVVDTAESSTVFRAPVADLLDPANRVSSVIERDGQRFCAPAFDVDGGFIWGFTGILMDRIFNDLGWTVPWDQGNEVSINLGGRRTR